MSERVWQLFSLPKTIVIFLILFLTKGIVLNRSLIHTLQAVRLAKVRKTKRLFCRYTFVHFEFMKINVVLILVEYKLAVLFIDGIASHEPDEMPEVETTPK